MSQQWLHFQRLWISPDNFEEDKSTEETETKEAGDEAEVDEDKVYDRFGRVVKAPKEGWDGCHGIKKISQKHLLDLYPWPLCRLFWWNRFRGLVSFSFYRVYIVVGRHNHLFSFEYSNISVPSSVLSTNAWKGLFQKLCSWVSSRRRQWNVIRGCAIDLWKEFRRFSVF